MSSRKKVASCIEVPKYKNDGNVIQSRKICSEPVVARYQKRGFKANM